MLHRVTDCEEQLRHMVRNDVNACSEVEDENGSISSVVAALVVRDAEKKGALRLVPYFEEAVVEGVSGDRSPNRLRNKQP